MTNGPYRINARLKVRRRTKVTGTTTASSFVPIASPRVWVKQPVRCHHHVEVLLIEAKIASRVWRCADQ